MGSLIQNGPPFAPTWLRPADVKRWLRLAAVDTTDDDLIAAVSAMTEAYVMRCRPEWMTPAGVVPEGEVFADPEFSPAGITLRLDIWIAQNPDGPDPLDGAGHWFAIDQMSGTTDTTPDDLPVWVAFKQPPGSSDRVPFDAPSGDQLTGGQLRAVYGRVLLQLRAVDEGGPVPTAFYIQGSAVFGYFPDAETYQGAVMYAAREYRRRNSPAGIEMFGDQASFVSRYDTDIERALQTGVYARPVIS